LEYQVAILDHMTIQPKIYQKLSAFIKSSYPILICPFRSLSWESSKGI